MRKLTGKWQIILLCAVLCAGIVSSTVWAGKSVQKYINTDFAMDTVVSETLYTTGDDINTAIGEKLREVEKKVLSWTDKDSEIYRLNTSGGKTMKVSEELAGYLSDIRQLCEDSGGAYDPTLGEVIRLWDIGGEDPQVPEKKELDSLMKKTGYQNIELDGRTVTLKNGATLDMGAVGKGIGCDTAMAYLEEQQEVSGMLLNLGGSSVMAYGEKPDGSDWRVAVTDPRDTEGGYLGAITLKNGEFLSTSGDYEKFFMKDGKRYHHILDPETGYPVWNGLTSVTVICSRGLFADGLSTACFVLGREKALELLEKYDADALFTDEDGNVYMTGGMKERFELMKNTYTVKSAN